MTLCELCGDNRQLRTFRLCQCKEVGHLWIRLLKKVLTSVTRSEEQTALAAHQALAAVAVVDIL